jgi:hypothetical protein
MKTVIKLASVAMFGATLFLSGCTSKKLPSDSVLLGTYMRAESHFAGNEMQELNIIPGGIAAKDMTLTFIAVDCDSNISCTIKTAGHGMFGIGGDNAGTISKQPDGSIIVTTTVPFADSVSGKWMSEANAKKAMAKTGRE